MSVTLQNKIDIMQQAITFSGNVEVAELIANFKDMVDNITDYPEAQKDTETITELKTIAETMMGVDASKAYKDLLKTIDRLEKVGIVAEWPEKLKNDSLKST